MKTALFKTGDYVAVIPHIQNMYGPEKDTIGWCIGFKYQSGVFEYFSYKTEREAEEEFERLETAVNKYWSTK